MRTRRMREAGGAIPHPSTPGLPFGPVEGGVAGRVMLADNGRRGLYLQAVEKSLISLRSAGSGITKP